MKKTVAIIIALVLTLTGIAVGMLACNDKETLRVGTIVVPHAEILNEVAKDMEARGVEIEVVVFTDWYLLNEAVNSGYVDVNYFQHVPYMEAYNEMFGTDLVSVGGIHCEPYAMYAREGIDNVESLTGIVVIAVPQDGTNMARALKLLEANGILTLKDGVDTYAKLSSIKTVRDGVEIIAEEPSKLPDMVKNSEVDAAVINGNYALENGFNIEEALLIESHEDVEVHTYANVLCVTEENKEDSRVQALLECLQSERIKNYIKNKYKGAVVPLG